MVFGILGAIINPYIHRIIENQNFMNIVLACEVIVGAWAIHQILKRAIFRGYKLYDALIDTLRLPVSYYKTLANRS